MKILYGKGYTEEDRRNFRPVIYSNTLLSIKTLVEQSDILGIAVEAADDKEMIAGLADDKPLDNKIAAAISRLWTDPGIKETYDSRSRFQLIDSAELCVRRETERGERSRLGERCPP